MDSNQNPTGQTLSITEPTNLFATITAQNISHFSEAMDTPSVSGTLGNIIPPFTRNESTTFILQGSYNLTNFDPMPEIQQFLHATAIPLELQDTDPVDILISTLDFQKGFKKLPDKTSSSPSGGHMTHYKVLAKDKGMSHILARAITLPFQHGFSPTRWRTAIQFMLEKEPGNPLITKIRVIQLLEADMNFAFRLLWGKRLVHHALAQNALTPLNFRGRPGYRVHSALLLKTLSYDYIRYIRLNAIIFNNDAKACFDRIIPSIGLMATKQLGMPPTASACMLATIQGMKFFICTAHGVTPGFFTSTLSALILGVLPGSGAAPCIWLSISCVLLHALSTHTTGFQAMCPRYSKTSKCLGGAFVDNTDLWLTSTSSSSSGTLIYSMQKVAQLWERLLFASGGALAIQKFFYYLVDWCWDHNGFPVLSSNITLSDPQLVMTSVRSTFIHTIPRVKTTLGSKHWECVYLQMDSLKTNSHIASSKHSSGYTTSVLNH